MEDIVTQGFIINDSDNATTLNIGIWNGKVDLAVWSKNRDSGQRGPLMKDAMGWDAQTMLRQLIGKIIEAQPNTKYPLLIQSWDDDNKKYKVDKTMVIGKSDDKIIYIEVQFQHNGNNKTLLYELKCPGKVVMGVDNMDRGEQSKIRAMAILKWLDSYVPTACLLTAKKWDPKNSKNNFTKSSKSTESTGAGDSFGGEAASF